MHCGRASTGSPVPGTPLLARASPESVLPPKGGGELRAGLCESDSPLGRGLGLWRPLRERTAAIMTDSEKRAPPRVPAYHDRALLSLRRGRLRGEAEAAKRNFSCRRIDFAGRAAHMTGVASALPEESRSIEARDSPARTWAGLHLQSLSLKTALITRVVPSSLCPGGASAPSPRGTGSLHLLKATNLVQLLPLRPRPLDREGARRRRLRNSHPDPDPGHPE